MRIFAGVVILAVLMAGCLDTGSGSGGSSDSSGSGGSGCDVECQDSFIGYSVKDTVWYLYNQNMVGRPSGVNQDVTAACALGGTVRITGYFIVSGTNQTNYLDFEFSGCRHARAGSYDMTFTGMVSQDGSFVQNGDTIAMTFYADALSYYGTANGISVSGYCTVSVSDNYGDVYGSVCGRSFSY